MNQPYTLLSALIAWTSISSVLADSADDALNRFYTEDKMNRLTSDVSTEISNALPEPKSSEGSCCVWKSSKDNLPSPFSVRPSFFFIRLKWHHLENGSEAGDHNERSPAPTQ